ncbi:hypothetical protein Bhyg_12122, partial [Pseudolycoriella hygida]
NVIVTSNSSETIRNNHELAETSTGCKFWKKRLVHDYRFETMQSVNEQQHSWAPGYRSP